MLSSIHESEGGALKYENEFDVFMAVENRGNAGLNENDEYSKDFIELKPGTSPGFFDYVKYLLRKVIGNCSKGMVPEDKDL